MAAKSEKLLIGPRITRFRKTLGVTQSRMAEDLGISTSYLNLMERNQRALSAKVLLKMAEIYDFDIAGFTEQSSQAVESVRRFIHANKNYFPKLDAAAEGLAEEIGYNKPLIAAALTDRLKEAHGIAVRIVPIDVMPQMLRYFDRHLKRINLSELLPQSGRRFQLAFQIGMLEHRSLIDEIVASAKLPGLEAEGLCRSTLANYFAAAVLMPYARFLQEAEGSKYDVDLLCHRFGTSFEQTAHRLTTLQKPDARGIPFFFVRIDVAGNVLSTLEYP